MSLLPKPFFSIIVPVYNKEKHLADTIKSVLAQSDVDFELILVVDPSTDNSEGVATSFSDHRIRIFKRDIAGPGGYAARNLGILHASGTWLAFLDADDTWEPDFLQVVRKAIDEHDDVNVYATGYRIKRRGEYSANLYKQKFSDQGSHSFSFEKFLLHKPIWTSVLVVLKDRMVKCGGFPEGRFSRGGDQETWFRLMKQERIGFWINQSGAVYNTDADNRVTKTARFDITTHPLFYAIRESLPTEKDYSVRMAMMKHWNLTAFSYLKNMAKAECLLSSDFYKYYFWNIKVVDYRVILFFLYSCKNIRRKRKK